MWRRGFQNKTQNFLTRVKRAIWIKFTDLLAYKISGNASTDKNKQLWIYISNIAGCVGFVLNFIEHEEQFTNNWENPNMKKKKSEIKI